ncbi:MAG: glucose-6-phosphate isomerase family protein, partial [Candidatus Moraniibacteriota bacterium]
RTHEKMQDVLMDPKGVGPAIHYYMLRGGVEQKNTTVWEPGTISGEYIKTYGHYHIGELSENYSIVFGQGVALLQKLMEDQHGNLLADLPQVQVCNLNRTVYHCNIATLKQCGADCQSEADRQTCSCKNIIARKQCTADSLLTR